MLIVRSTSFVFLVKNVLAKVINIIVYLYNICIKCISMSLVNEFTRSGSIFCRFFKIILRNSSTVCFNGVFLITNSVAVTMSIYIFPFYPGSKNCKLKATQIDFRKGQKVQASY